MSDVTPTRPSGGPPFFAPGRVVHWHYRNPRWRPGDPETITPVRVVRDDADGFAAWLAVGTPYLLPRLVGGGDLRSGDARTAFLEPREQGEDVWRWYDVLRVAPTGRAWSVWLFFEEGSRAFQGWYVNLEDPHVRDAEAVYSTDHVLDVEVDLDRSHHRKDVDELAAAVEQGRYTPAEGEAIEALADEVEAVVDVWGPPFCDGWEEFRPDPSWEVPSMPARP